MIHYVNGTVYCFSFCSDCSYEYYVPVVKAFYPYCFEKSCAVEFVCYNDHKDLCQLKVILFSIFAGFRLKPQKIVYEARFSKSVKQIFEDKKLSLGHLRFIGAKIRMKLKVL